MEISGKDSQSPKCESKREPPKYEMLTASLLRSDNRPLPNISYIHIFTLCKSMYLIWEFCFLGLYTDFLDVVLLMKFVLIFNWIIMVR